VALVTKLPRERLLTAQAMAVCVTHRYGLPREPLLVNPSKILSIAPIFDSDPASVHIELLCSICGEADALVLNLEQPGNLSWFRRHDFYFVCGRHRHVGLN
jgi:hypothetical protein